MNEQWSIRTINYIVFFYPVEAKTPEAEATPAKPPSPVAADDTQPAPDQPEATEEETPQEPTTETAEEPAVPQTEATEE